MKDLAVLIAAGGSSSRYGRDKLFEMLGGIPVFVHSVLNFSGSVGQMILVAPTANHARFAAALAEYAPHAKVTLAAGGNCRAQSVRNGLSALTPDIGYVAIHDAARPLSKLAHLRELYRMAVEHGCGVISGRMAVDSMKRLDGEGFIERQVDRDRLFRAETPQLFPREMLDAAMSAEADPGITDDAMAVCASGGRVMACCNPDPNPKLTVPGDLRLLESLLI